MKVTLSIENDAELRAYIKDLIRGQVLSIVRSDVEHIMKDVVTGKVNGFGVGDVVKNQIKQMVTDELKGSGWNSPGYIKVEAQRIVDIAVKDALKDFNPFKK